MTLTERDRGVTRTLRVGETLVLCLKENPTTGYQWEIGELDAEILAVQGLQYVPAGEGGFGEGGQKCFTLVARSSGTSPVRLKLKRRWEQDEDAIDYFEVTVHVQ